MAQVSHQALSPQSRLRGGDYNIESSLGIGGFGITYRATDYALGRLVAIKEFFPVGCIRESATVQPGGEWTVERFAHFRQRFKEEGRTLAQLHHPGIVHVYSVFEENETVYLVMEFVEGVTLEEYRIARGGRLDIDESVSMIRQIGEALCVVHQAHVLHRDIKPANIIRRPNGQVVLIDFGAAREFRSGSGGTVIFTPGYAPLEQYGQEGECGPFSDIYALSATLYHLITGELPLDAASRASGTRALPSPTQLRSEIPQAVSEAVMMGLNISSNERPSNVQAFLQMLSTGAGAPSQRLPIWPGLLCLGGAVTLFLFTHNLWLHWIASIVLMTVTVLWLLLAYFSTMPPDWDVKRTRRENASLRGRFIAELTMFYMTYVENALLLLPYADFSQRYNRLIECIQRSTAQQVTDAARANMLEEVMAIPLPNTSDFLPGLRQAANGLPHYHDQLIEQSSQGLIASSGDLVALAALPESVITELTDHLIQSLAPVNQRIAEAVSVQRPIMEQYHQMLKKLRGGGFISWVEDVFTDKRERYGNDLTRYLNCWDMIAQALDTAVIPVQRRIYANAIQTAVKRWTVLFDEYDQNVISLKPLLKELEHENRNEAKRRKALEGRRQ